ncbi:MAG: aminotransferase class I/II-fold pyridoxal phosphate-dependent enzyme [Acidimicrobiia bacterium]|nr:aminotransferase class I/II-fold pyridoxal phosphate-dependent enzyme [Acidimicrobiia bacterium]
MESAADVVGDIERRVADGVLRPGDRLPPVRTMAAQVGLAPNTVAAAYRMLQSRGILIGKGRAGTFVSARPPVSGSVAPTVPPGVIDLSTGNPDPSFLPDLPPQAFAAHPPVLYGAPSIDEQLAVAASRWLAADGITAQEIVPVSGALDGMERVLAAHLRPGDRVAVEDPAYAAVVDLLAALGLLPVPVAVDDHGPLVDALAAAVESGVQAVVITPRAQNPRGAALTGGRANALRHALASTESVLVIEDDHAGQVSGSELHSIIDRDRPRWAHIRSVAKELGPDLRVAVVAADATTRRRVLGRQRVGPGWVSHHLQRAVALLLDDAAVTQRLTAAANAYAERRTFLIDTLAAAGVEAHGRSGLNVWVPTADEGAVVAALLERGFAVRSGSAFRLQSAPGVRVTVAGHPVETLDEVADAFIEAFVSTERIRTG